MGETGQTPGVFLRGGGSGFFSAGCVKALAKCGLHPDDFGTYDQVKEKLRAAKSRVLEHKLATRRGEPNAAPQPSAHDRLLATSEAGHLRQNALFQRERGNSCQNEQSGGEGFPGAAGYHHDLAPCGPHPTGTGRSIAGTTHWAQGEHEAGIRQDRDPGKPVRAQEIQRRSEETARLTAHGPTNQQLQEENHHARNRRDKEADARQASAEELKKANRGKVQGAADVPGGVADSKKAAECIQQYTDLGMDAMRQQVMHDYSDEVVPGTDPHQTRYEQTSQRLQAQEDRTQQRRADAEQRFQDELARARAAPPGPGSWDGMARAGMERSQARQDYAQARAANASAPCLRAQAAELRKGGALPEMSGSVPGWGQGRASRERYQIDIGTKTDGVE